jgi:hypothetical protein
MTANIAPDATAESLPYSAWWPPLAGMLVGILLRLLYGGQQNEVYNAMSGSFILYAPLAVGAITVYIAERSARRSWRYYLAAGVIANLLFIAGTLAIMIEGLICAVIIAPMFAIIGAARGLLMGVVCRVTEWPRHAAYGFIALPLVLGAIPAPEPAERNIAVTERHMLIAAAPAVVWQQLLDAPDIRPGEVGQAWMYRIGVPLPLAGLTRQTPAGLIRHVTMGKAIHFDQVSTAWEENRFVNWHYRFAADSFPAGALDDHVKIGGAYFDVIDTEYVLTPAGAGATSLTIRMHYRVSTEFNWYAKPIAKLLIGNFEEVILGFYSGRATSAGGSS